jgi:hypothetical protein
MVYNCSKEKNNLSSKISSIIFKKLRSRKLYHPNHEPHNCSNKEHATLSEDDNIVAGDECSK